MHILALLGPPGCGKSKVFQVTNQRLIPGTSRDLGSETAKAKMTPGNKTDMMIEIFEDVPPNQLGISSFSNHGKPGQVGTSNTDGESLLKYRLTKGRIFSTYKVVKDGKHMMLEVESWCNTVMLVGMNSALCQVPTPIASRFVNLQCQYKDRNDGGGLFNRLVQDRKSAGIPIKNQNIKRDQRNQCFHALIGLCIYLGIFEPPNMEVCAVIWSQTLALAKTIGLHETNNIRHIERLFFHAEVLMVDDATDRVLDSELSPFRDDQQWHRYCLLEWEKHLYGNTEHACMAMGLLQSQWESPIIAAVEAHFKKVLKAKIKNRDFGKPHQNQTIYHEMQYYYVIKTDLSSASLSQFDQMKAMQQDSQIARLADWCYQAMNPKPDKEEIAHALLNMMNLHLEVDDMEKPNSTKSIPSLAFAVDGGETMIAVKLMENYSSNRLRGCLTEVLCHAHTHRKNVLYGQMHEQLPYIWQTLKIEPRPHNRLRMIKSDYHSEAVLQMNWQRVKNVNTSSSVEDPSLIHKENTATLESFARNFSSVPYMDIDMDLDEMAAKRQCELLGLNYLHPQSDAPGFNTSMSPSIDTFWTLVRTLETCKIYPVCFKEINDSQHKMDIESDRQQHPHKYSLTGELYDAKSREPSSNERMPNRV